MAGVLQHLRSSTLDKRPNPGSMVDGQVAINYASGSPGMFFKDSDGNLVKVGPVHVGSAAPNASPASGGTAGNSVGEQWLDTSGGTYVFKVWDGSAWRSEAGEFVNVTGDTMTGTLTIGSGATIAFEGTTDDGFETTLTVVDPTADRTIALPNVSGTVVTTGDTGSVTSTMIADGTIVNADVNASAAIAGTKISPNFGSQNVTTTGTSTAASFIPSSSTVPANGVYLPAANSVAISTASSGRLFIDASGNVGIKTDAPDYLLTAQGSSASINVKEPGDNSAARVTRFIWSFDDGDGAAINATRNSGATAADAYLTFRTGGVTNSEERLRITSTGLVGAGTTIPLDRLHLYGAGQTTANITDAGTRDCFLRVSQSGAAAGTGGGILFATQQGDAANSVGFAAIKGLLTNGADNTAGDLAFSTRNAASDAALAERLRITYNGKIGIGIANPSAKFVTNGDVGSLTAQFLQADDTVAERIIIAQSTAGQNFGAYVDSSNVRHLVAGQNDILTSNGDVITFHSNNGSEAARIDSAGRLLIGTSNARNVGGIAPSFLLEGTSLNTGSAGIINNVNSATGAYLTLGKSRGTSIGGTTTVLNGDLLAQFRIVGADGSSIPQVAAHITANVDGVASAGDVPGRLAFSTSTGGATYERLRITSTGEVYIAGTTDRGAYNLQVNGTGVWAAGAYVNGSDERLKEDIEPMADASAVLQKLRPVTFKYKADYSRDQNIQPGFIAQELQEAMAGQVYLDGIVQQGPEYLSVAYQGLIPVLTKALQEALGKIDSLEARLKAAGL